MTLLNNQHQRAKARHEIEAGGGEFIYNVATYPGQRVVFQSPSHGDSVDFA